MLELSGLSRHWSCACGLIAVNSYVQLFCVYKVLSLVTLMLTLTISPYPLPQRALSLWRNGVRHRYRAETSTVSYSLRLDQLWVFCVNHHLLEKASLMKADGYTNLWI